MSNDAGRALQFRASAHLGGPSGGEFLVELRVTISLAKALLDNTRPASQHREKNSLQRNGTAWHPAGREGRGYEVVNLCGNRESLDIFHCAC